jgi:hypothetical protein
VENNGCLKKEKKTQEVIGERFGKMIPRQSLGHPGDC